MLNSSFTTLNPTDSLENFTCKQIEFSCPSKFNDSASKTIPVEYILGNVFICIFSLIGVICNTVALIVFRRLKWHRENAMLLFIISTVTNLLACVGITSYCSYLIIKYYKRNYIWKQITCIGFSLPVSIGITSSLRCAFLVAIERLMAQWFAFQWLRWSTVYKWLLMAIIWSWTIFQESFWLYFIPEDSCVLWCFWGYLSYPNSGTWLKVETISDFCFALATALIFLIVPISDTIRGKSLVRQIKKECFIITETNIYLKQREKVARIRLLSFIYLIGFFCTSFLNVSISYFFTCEKNSTWKTSVNVQAGLNVLTNVHIALTSLIFLIDASFRWELKRCLNRLLCVLGKIKM